VPAYLFRMIAAQNYPIILNIVVTDYICIVAAYARVLYSNYLKFLNINYLVTLLSLNGSSNLDKRRETNFSLDIVTIKFSKAAILLKLLQNRFQLLNDLHVMRFLRRGHGGTPKSPNSRPSPRRSGPEINMEEVMPKMVRRRSSDVGQSRRRWGRSCSWWS